MPPALPEVASRSAREKVGAREQDARLVRERSSGLALARMRPNPYI